MNSQVVAFASAARTATVTSSTYTNRGCKGARVMINVSAIVDTPSITVSLQEHDPVSATDTALLTSAAIASTGQKTTLLYFPGATASANVAVNGILPYLFNIKVTHSDGDSISYSVVVDLIE